MIQNEEDQSYSYNTIKTSLFQFNCQVRPMMQTAEWKREDASFWINIHYKQKILCLAKRCKTIIQQTNPFFVLFLSQLKFEYKITLLIDLNNTKYFVQR